MKNRADWILLVILFFIAGAAGSYFFMKYFTPSTVHVITSYSIHYTKLYEASTLEPKFAEPHIFLAIAYYQLEDVGRAMEELQLAIVLDPRDPVRITSYNYAIRSYYDPGLSLLYQ